MAAVGKTKFKNQFYLKHKLFNTVKLHTAVRNRRDCVCGKKTKTGGKFHAKTMGKHDFPCNHTL